MRVFLLLLLFAANTLFARWYYMCQVLHKCAEEQPVVSIETRLKTLRLQEGDTVLLEGYDQFVFDSTSVLPRLNENNSQFLDTLAGYLRLSPQKDLTISGFYRASEEKLQAGMYENIGTARAEAVRRLLLKRGVAEERVKLDYQKSADSLLREPIAFNVYVPSAIPTSFEKQQFSFTNMTFSDANFPFDSDKFNPSKPFILYADSVRTYLAVNPAKSMTIIGHTDNVGSNNYNLNLGLRRAQSARYYFLQKGVKANIKVASQGEKRPAASNESEEGRQKNRRVNFILE